MNVPHILYLFFYLTEEHLSCFQFLAITKIAAVNTVEQVSLRYGGASLDICPGVV